MASNTSMFAMYIIGKTESNNTWDSINFNDPITVGMMQWYGTRAAKLLNLLDDYHSAIAEPLRSQLASQDENNASFWTNKWLSAAEGATLRPILSSEDGKTAQQMTWDQDYLDNVSTLESYGFSESRPKPLILLMSALHQSPARARAIARNYGGNSDLLRIYRAIQAEPVLSRYMTHRYTPTYNALNAWNGTDAPPDFGQVIGSPPPPGGTDPDPTPPPTGTTPDNPAEKYGIAHVQQYGDHLHMYTTDGRTVVALQQSVQSWTLTGGLNGGVVPVEPPETPVPPIPEPDPDIPTTGWAHPCPGRSRVSSEFRGPGRPNHNGIDMAAPLGTALYAVADGEVLRSGSATGFGGYIGIKLDGSPYAVGYGHMKISDNVVKTGDRVRKGQLISRVGNEGQSTGPHLHFEVYSNGTLFSGHINPRPVLETNGVTP